MTLPVPVNDRRANNVMFESKPDAPVRLLFRNFAGKEGQYNREGDRNFCVLLPPDLAAAMLNDGWNIKSLRSRSEDEPPQAYIQVAVSYKGRPPRVVIITTRRGEKVRTELFENEVEILDWVDIRSVDLIIRPYHWSVSGKTGVKAYLKSLFITIEEDPLELKYNDLPEANEPAALESTKLLAIEGGQNPNDGLDEDIVDAEIMEDED